MSDPRRGPTEVTAAAVSLAVLAAVFVAVVAMLTPWETLPGTDIVGPPVGEYFTPAQAARSEAFHDAAKWPGWLGLAVSLLVAAAVGFTAAGRRLVELGRARVRRWWLQVVALVAAVTVIQTVAGLPFSAWGRNVALDYGLTTQSWGGWAVDVLKSVGIGFGLTSLALLALVGLARWLPRWWFVAAATGAGALVVAMSFAFPVVIAPVFNSFIPLPDEALRSELLQLADEDGVEVSEVLVADASRRTTTLNAYVSGFGATKRIVVYDTLLAEAPSEEIELIVAHELGHAEERDVLKGTLLGAVGAGMAMVALFLALRSDRLRRGVGASSAGDPAVVPLVLALAVLVGFVGSPVQNTISRQIEERADAHSLALTDDPETFIDMQQRLAVNNISHLRPDPVLSFWFGSHPTTLDRIGMALAWKRLYGDRDGAAAEAAPPGE